MADRFDKFTERARLALTSAEQEARRLGHNYIGTEHLLLGVLRVTDGVAAHVLAALGAELGAVRQAVEFIIGRADRAVLGAIGLTPRGKKAIELAVDEARQLNHRYIGTEHLLLGLVREGEGIAASVLVSLGADLERVRAETTRTLSQPTPVTRRAVHIELSTLDSMLPLPAGLLSELQQLAARHHTTTVGMLRRLVRLGLIATEIRDTPGTSLVIHLRDSEREITL